MAVPLQGAILMLGRRETAEFGKRFRRDGLPGSAALAFLDASRT